jgi:hypothetical protein
MSWLWIYLWLIKKGKKKGVDACIEKKKKTERKVNYPDEVITYQSTVNLSRSNGKFKQNWYLKFTIISPCCIDNDATFFVRLRLRVFIESSMFLSDENFDDNKTNDY